MALQAQTRALQVPRAVEFGQMTLFDGKQGNLFKRSAALWLSLLLYCLPSFTQTRVDLRSQAKTIDFSQSIFTKPVKTGTALPAVCEVGELFFRTNSTPGKNLYSCTATNIWTLIGDSLSIPPGANGQFLSTDGQSLTWRSFAGGVSGALQSTSGAADFTVDIDTAVLPRKAMAETIGGLWNFDRGIILNPRSAPSNPVNGQIWYDASLQRFRCHENGVTVDCTGGGSGALMSSSLSTVDPGMRTEWVDEFCGSGEAPSREDIGALPWAIAFTGNGLRVGNKKGDLRHPCIVVVETGTESGGGSVMSLGEAAGSASLSGWDQTDFELNLVFQLDPVTSNHTFRFGLADDPLRTQPANRLTVRANGGENAQFTFEACTEGVCAPEVESGVPVDGNWHRVKLFRRSGDAPGTVRFCMDACLESKELTERVPSGEMAVFTSIFNNSGESASARLALDWFSASRKGALRW